MRHRPCQRVAHQRTAERWRSPPPAATATLRLRRKRIFRQLRVAKLSVSVSWPSASQNWCRRDRPRHFRRAYLETIRNAREQQDQPHVRHGNRNAAVVHLHARQPVRKAAQFSTRAGGFKCTRGRSPLTVSTTQLSASQHRRTSSPPGRQSFTVAMFVLQLER